MKKLIAYIVMAAVIATLFCACGDGRIDDNPVTSPLLSPDVSAQVSPDTRPEGSPQVSPMITADPDNGTVEDNDGFIGNEDNSGDDNILNTPAVTANP